MGSPPPGRRCFTVSGEIGSGKSSVARLLADRTGAEFHSTGSLQRRLASGRKLSTLEMNLLSESEPTIDAEIDGFTRELAAAGGDFVIDSRMAWHFVPEALKIFLLVDTERAARRVLGDQPRRSDTESYRGSDEALRDIVARQESERRRFLQTYGVDLFRWSNYDLVIETSDISAEETVRLILGHPAGERRPPTHLWLAPRSIYPTEHVRVLAGPATETLLASMRERGFDPRSPLRVVASRDRGLYVLDGHRRLSCALRLGLPIVPCRLAGQDGDELVPDLSVETLIAAQPRRSWLFDWEAAHDFRYRSYPEPPGHGDPPAEGRP